MVKRATWLSITPEPERELPWAVATLRAGRLPSGYEIEDERARIERLLLHGGQGRWLSYLHGVVELIQQSARGHDPDVERARARAAAVISNHHSLLLGLPGRAAQRTAADRATLLSITTQERDLHEHSRIAAQNGN
jgi:hypothetical protein